MIPFAALLGVVALAARSPDQSPVPPAPIFLFHTDELWLNLHHFLYVLGRAEAKMGDASRDAVAGAPSDAERGLAGLSPEEQQTWRRAVTFYAAGPSRKDAVFDEPLPAIAHALADAGDRAALPPASFDPALRATLDSAAPIYRKAWWPAHQAANVAWRDQTQALADRHGQAVLAFITKAYGMTWPSAGYAVHVSAYANWAGAYSTAGNLLVVSSLDRATRGLPGLETVFHEGMHQWDEAMQALIGAEARRANKRVPPFLSHGLIFFTAGEAVRRLAPGYVPYADANGVWRRGQEALRGVLQETWKPYLDGTGTRDEALAAVIARAGS